MSAHARIQWLHKKITENCYPNAMRLAEKFHISHRQAQRDIDYLRRELGAPVTFSATHRGYYYNSEYTLPLYIATENDSDYMDVVSDLRSFNDRFASRSVLQMQLPYTATLVIHDRLTVMNLRSFIVAEEPKHRYRCEFQSVELFLGVLVSMDADVRVESPEWLRDRLVNAAQRVLKNNS
ncbi:MAG: hypothetical protein E7664_02760 [Ruminococcaceae bacterium]|nr:hypothetical protein [Oscillospiraceae bacterium]